MLGLSISAKYITLMFGVSVGTALVFVFCLKGANKKFLLKGMLLLGVGAVIAASYWFVRNYVLTGDVHTCGQADRAGTGNGFRA